MLFFTTLLFFFFLNDPAPTEFYPLPLHDALPIWPMPTPSRGARWILTAPAPRPFPPLTTTTSPAAPLAAVSWPPAEPSVSPACSPPVQTPIPSPDRKSTRLNSSHLVISYAVFCLK